MKKPSNGAKRLLVVFFVRSRRLAGNRQIHDGRDEPAPQPRDPPPRLFGQSVRPKLFRPQRFSRPALQDILRHSPTELPGVHIRLNKMPAIGRSQFGERAGPCARGITNDVQMPIPFALRSFERMKNVMLLRTPCRFGKQRQNTQIIQRVIRSGHEFQRRQPQKSSKDFGTPQLTST